MTISDLQRKFRLGYVSAKWLHEQLQRSASPGLTFHCREDEMLVFHLDGRWHATIYASGPESAIQIEEWLKGKGASDG